MAAILAKPDEYDRGKVLESFEKALGYRSLLVEAHPSVSDYRERLAVSLTEIAQFRHQVGRTEEALDASRRSIEILEKLVSPSATDQPRYRAELGRALNILGYLHDELRDNVRALPLLERALREEERAVAELPESDLYRTTLILILQNLGEQYADLGRVGEGLPYYRRTVVESRKRWDAHPGDRARTLSRFAEQLAMLAEVEPPCRGIRRRRNDGTRRPSLSWSLLNTAAGRFRPSSDFGEAPCCSGKAGRRPIEGSIRRR